MSRDDPFEVAVEHIAWAVSQGWGPSHVFASIGAPLPAGGATWSAAIWAVAKAYEDLGRADSAQLALRLVA